MLQLISQEISNDTLVVRKHIDDLTAKSQLIVYESQEAIFVKNGQTLDLFAAGRYTLDTANVPLIKKFFSNLFGGSAPFPCDVFFVNKVNQLDFVWGTDTPITLQDPKFSMFVGVRANGQTGFRISDSRRFITKISGMMSEYTVDALKKTVKGLILAPIKECIAQTILEKQVGVLEITSILTEISEDIQAKLNARIGDLGISIDHFTVNAILPSDGDFDVINEALNKAKADMTLGMNEANIEAYKLRVVSQARAEARAAEGYTYADERRFDVLEHAAKNEGAGGSLINMGVGLGVGAGVGGAVGKMADRVINPQPNAANTDGEAICSGCGAKMPAGSKFCMNCGQPRPTAKFCPECGTKAQDGAKFCMNCGTKLA